MKAAIHLAMGDLEKSKSCMDECLQLLPYENFQHPMLDAVVRLYYQVIENELESSRLDSPFRLCKDYEHKQPTGVKVKFWFGVGEILAGVLLAPFSGGASIALISMGTSFLVNASCEALNNKDQWEKDLNDRQNINPADTENNSFIEPIRESICVIRV